MSPETPRARSLCLPFERWRRLATHSQPASWIGLRRADSAHIRVHGRRILVLTEATPAGWTHPTSREDIRRILDWTPPAIVEGISFVILHVPVRKELAAGAPHGWARKHWEFRRHRGHAIALNAVGPHERYVWSRPRGPWDHDDIQRIRRYGGRLEIGRGGVHTRMDRRSLRAWLLYHVLLHEIGHAAQPAGYAAPGEQGAEAFATHFESWLESRGAIPFAPIPDRMLKRRHRRGWTERVQRRFDE